MPSRLRVKIETIGLVFKPEPRRAAPILAPLTRWLDRRHIRWTVDVQTARLLSRPSMGLPRPDLASASDLILVVGGDGTLLSVARDIGSKRTPILGVNLGSLGFLTEIPIEELYTALSGILAGRGAVVRRTRLEVTILHQGKKAARHDVLNDVVVAKSAIARILDINVSINDRLATAFQADGLIVCTPTGSTAYSLSAGGPIVDPAVAAMILSPICPHTLSNRPIVTPIENRVEISLARNHGEVYVTLDGQVGIPFTTGDRLHVRRSPHPVRMIRFQQHDYFGVLRQKLRWGGRVRGGGGE